MAHKIRLTSLLTLLLTTLYAFGLFQTDGAHLFEFIRDSVHITTARALMNFQFFWSDVPSLGVLHDTQFYNGAVFPNSGYGVALLQIPFHFIWNLISNSKEFTPFPDRLIFLIYCLPVLYFIYYSIIKFLSSVHFACRTQRELLAATVTLALSVHSVYYLMSMYFCIYESNVAYFLLFEIVAVLSTIHYHHSQNKKWLIIAGISSGLGLLIRPTGAILLLVWLILLFMGRPFKTNLRPALLYATSSSPLLLYWFISNYIRSGGLFATGFNNVIPLIPELHTLRFGGNPCFTDFSSYLNFFLVLIKNIFGTWNGHGHFYVTNLPAGLNNCGLIFESADDTLMRAPFIPFIVSIGSLIITTYQVIFRKRYDILLAALTILFFLILHTIKQSGFGARYVADLWPLYYYIFLASIPINSKYVPNIKITWLIIFILFSTSLWSLKSSIGKISQERYCVASRAEDLHVNPSIFHREEVAYKLNRYRYRTGQVVDYRSALNSTLPVQSLRLSTEAGAINLIQDKYGWDNNGQVDNISYFYITVPDKLKNSYELILKTSDIKSKEIQIYLNGEVKKVNAAGNEVRAQFHIEHEKLFSPMLAVAIQWEKSFNKPGIQLFSAELR